MKTMKTLPSILLGLACLTSTLSAQVVLENSAQSIYTKNATSTDVASFDSSGGNYLIAFVSQGEVTGTTLGVSGITFGTSSFTNLGSASISGTENGRDSLMSVWYLANPTGTEDVTASITGSGGSGMSVFSVSNAADPTSWLTDTASGITNSTGPDTLSTSLNSVPTGTLLLSGFASTRGLRSVVYTDSVIRDGDFNYENNAGEPYASSVTWVENAAAGNYTLTGYLNQGDTGQDDYASTYSTIGITAIPEPSTFALFAGALGLALVMQRRRR